MKQDETFKMTFEMGRALYNVCRPFFKRKINFAMLTRIGPETLENYWHGKKDIGYDHFLTIGSACNKTPEELSQILLAAYKSEEQIKQEREEARKRQIAWEENRPQREAHKRMLEDQRKENERLENEARIKAERKWCEEHPEEALQKRLKEEKSTQTKNFLSEIGVVHTKLDSKNIDSFIDSTKPSQLKFIIENLKQFKEQAFSDFLRHFNDEEFVLDGESALIWASRSDFPYEILQLLQDRTEFIAQHIHDREKDGITALHHVARNDDSGKAIPLLVQWGAEINAQDKYLWTPLHDAGEANQGNDKRWDALIACGADNTIINNEGNTAEDIRFRQDAIDAW